MISEQQNMIPASKKISIQKKIFRNRRKGIAILIFAVLLSGCGHAHKTADKNIKVSHFTDLIIDENQVLPNLELAWNMETGAFLEQIYGAETLNPEQEAFEADRYYHSEEQKITTMTPPICYQIDRIPQKAEVTYAFNETGLYKAGYSWIFEENEIESITNTISILCDDFNASACLTESIIEIPDFSKEETMKLPYRVTWLPVDSSGQSVELLLNKIQDSFFIIVTVKNS